MPVPGSMQDLAQQANANFPTGSELIGTNLDDYLRAHASILRRTYSLASSPVAAGSTTDVTNADGESVEITGTATINSLGIGFVGCYRELRFAAACTLVHSNNLVLPFATSASVRAGDALTFRCTAAGQWKQVTTSNAVTLGQLNEAIEDALASGGNYDVTPRQWSFTGDGVIADIPIPGADVDNPLAYYVAMEETAGSGLYGVQIPLQDYIVLIGEDPNDSVLRMTVPPGDTFRGDIRLLGYSRPFLGPPPANTAPMRVVELTDTALTIDGTFHNTLVVCTSGFPTTITVRADTGSAELDWKSGQFCSIYQGGAGKVMLVAEGAGTIELPSGFNAETRSVGATVAITCRDPQTNKFLASGDLLRQVTSQIRDLITLVDMSVLIGTNIAAGTGKASFVLPFGLLLDSIADGGLYASLAVAQAAGSIFTVDVNRNGISILSTKLTIDNTEKTTKTAATAAVYVAGGDVLYAGDEITIDVDQVGTALAKGLRVYLVGRRAS